MMHLSSQLHMPLSVDCLNALNHNFHSESNVHTSEYLASEW